MFFDLHSFLLILDDFGWFWLILFRSWLMLFDLSWSCLIIYLPILFCICVYLCTCLLVYVLTCVFVYLYFYTCVPSIWVLVYVYACLLVYIEVHFATTKCLPIHFLQNARQQLTLRNIVTIPLIKNILDSSSWYLSNVTFGTSLAFKMREEYVLDFFF